MEFREWISHLYIIHWKWNSSGVPRITLPYISKMGYRERKIHVRRGKGVEGVAREGTGKERKGKVLGPG